MRPLVVFTGQGLALADDFNLTKILRNDPQLEAECFNLVPEAERNDLDAVFRACGGKGARAYDLLINRTRKICFERRQSDQPLPQHRALLAALAKAATERLVLHLTTNIDGFTTRIAVYDFGATWRARKERSHQREIENDVVEAYRAQRGLLHFPVHGEVGLLAVQGLPFPGDVLFPGALPKDDIFQGARLLETYDVDPEGKPRYSTIYQGIGRNRVKDVPKTMAFSKAGYRLLGALIAARTTQMQYREVPPYRDTPLEPADLLVVGYGAGGSPERDDYPFESVIDRARKAAALPPADAKWRAFCYKPGEVTPRRTLDWFTARGFEIVPHEDDLAGAVRTVLG